MSGICSAHQYHHPGCRLCSYDMGNDVDENVVVELVSSGDKPVNPQVLDSPQVMLLKQRIDAQNGQIDHWHKKYVAENDRVLTAFELLNECLWHIQDDEALRASIYKWRTDACQ